MSSAKRPVLITAKLHSQGVLSQRPVNLIPPPPPPSPLSAPPSPTTAATTLRIQVWILAHVLGKDASTAVVLSTLFGQTEYFQDRKTGSSSSKLPYSGGSRLTLVNVWMVDAKIQNATQQQFILLVSVGKR